VRVELKATPKTGTIVAALLCAPLLSQQSPARDFNPANSNTLHYGVEWRLVRAGSARLAWTPSSETGYQADLHLESSGLVSKLYRVNDQYRAILKPDLCASTVKLHAEEGKRRRDTKVTFAGGKASYLETDLIKKAVVLSKDIEVPACTYEYTGALNKLRSMRLEPGQSAQLPLSDGKKFAQVKVDAREREQVKTTAGTFTAIKHEVHMFNGVLIGRKARMYVWISDDARRLPVQIQVRMAFLIGTITLQLEKEEQH
jgi:hypothetical protein